MQSSTKRKPLPWHLTDEQSKAIGAIMIFSVVKKSDDKEFNKYVAKIAIRLQTFF